jgi:hypothetical protein
VRLRAGRILLRLIAVSSARDELRTTLHGRGWEEFALNEGSVVATPTPPSRMPLAGSKTEAIFNRLCGSGGIGRRAGLRIQWGNPSGFESRLSHIEFARGETGTSRALRASEPIDEVVVAVNPCQWSQPFGGGITGSIVYRPRKFTNARIRHSPRGHFDKIVPAGDPVRPECRARPRTFAPRVDGAPRAQPNVATAQTRQTESSVQAMGQVSGIVSAAISAAVSLFEIIFIAV